MSLVFWFSDQDSFIVWTIKEKGDFVNTEMWINENKPPSGQKMAAFTDCSDFSNSTETFLGGFFL